ncbi:MarR family EPS-associated transcriptional regulator [Polaromonas sp. P1(28)-8]|nr:MarR family EPS-associated transcriptional regulator [Polaromonas sp. P1(28)-8]
MNISRLPVPTQDLPYHLLCQLIHEPAASQRGLAERLGVSLGKVNYCLRALVDKGLVKANNFRRSDNKLAYAYVLTPAGLEEKRRLTQAFLQRKLTEFEVLQQEIEALRHEAEQIEKAEKAEPA